MLTGQCAGSLTLLEHIVGQQSPELISGERGPGSTRLQGERGRTAHPVAVGVCGQYQFGSDIASMFDHRVEDARVLGVGDMAWYIGKITARLGMRFVKCHVLEACPLQDGADGRGSHAMQRRVDHFHSREGPQNSAVAAG